VRNTAIAAAVKSGLPYQAVGDVFGLTRERIRQIVARDSAKSQMSARSQHEASRRAKGAAR
jgi:DNA-directed RNA polymerase sigma subunit (sigma70/sigma32)